MALVWTFGSYDFIAQGSVPGSLKISRGWRLNPSVVPRRDGALTNSSPLNDGVRFTLSGVLYATSAALLRAKEDILKAAIADGRQKLLIHDDRYMMATIEHLGWDIAPVPGLRAASFTLDLYGDEGVWLAQTPGSAGLTTNNSVPATNTGNMPAPPTITITAPGGGLTQVILQNAGNTLTWNGSLTSGQDLAVDMDVMTLSEGGVETAAGFSTGSVFWDLAAGNNTVTVSSTPTGASTAIAWRDRWL